MGFNCQYDRAIHSLRKSLEINEAANVLWGISTVKSLMSAWGYNYKGKIHLGYKSSEEAMQIAESSGDIYSQAHSYTYHGFSCFCKGQFIEAERLLRNAIDLSSSINLVLMSMLAYHWGSDTYYYMGEYRKSEDCLRKELDLLEQERISSSLQSLGRIGLARAKVMNNEMDIDLPTLYRYATSNKVRAHEGWMSRCVVEILLNIDEKHLPEAEVWIKKAIASDIKNGMLFSLANDHAVYAELLKRKGNLLEAKENLNKAIDIFKECGAAGWVKKYEEELSKF
jgi:tetratricopeptide (TPR) repeat protein